MRIMGGKGTPRYRVVAHHGETRGGGGVDAASDGASEGYGTRKFTYDLTVPMGMTARDRKRNGAEGARG